MTIYDKGLIRAMKQAYKEDGYYVAVIEDGILIQSGSRIKPTRLIMDGCRVWQTTDKLKIKLVHVDSQQILADQSVDAYLVAGNYVYGRNWFGCMFIRTEMVVHEDVPLLDHLAEMQWIPVEIDDV